MDRLPYISADLTLKQCRKVARSYGVKVPRVGYEVSLGNGLWLSSTGHCDFGWLGREGCKTPFRVHGYRRATA